MRAERRDTSEIERVGLRRLIGVLLSGFDGAPLVATTLAVMSVALAASAVCYSIGFRLIIDGAIAGHSGEVVWGVVMVAALFTLSWVLTIASGTRRGLLTDRTNLVLGLRIMRLAARLPTLEHFERSDMLARLEQLTQNRRTLAGATGQIVGLLGQGLQAIGMVVLLATVYPPVLIVPAFALAPAWSDRLAGRMQQRADDAMAEDVRMLEDLFSLATGADSARELRTYGITGALTERHDRLVARVQRQRVRVALISAALEGIGWVIFAAALVGAIVVLVLRAAAGHVSPGSVVMAVSLLRRAQTQISRSTDTASNFNTSVAAARQLLWLEDHAVALTGTPTAASDVGEGAVPERLRRGIHLEEVSFTYPALDADPDAAPALGPITLEIPAGASVALVGDNGAGKTTLVKLLAGMYRPTAGVIEVDGVDLSGLPVAAWRARLSAAFQDFQRLQFVLSESVGLGDLPRVGEPDVIRRALAGAGADQLEDELPDGLATRVGYAFTGGHELSGGQWQRLALARGLMRSDPLLVVLDEPTASLDAPTEHALFDRYITTARELGAAHGTITLLVSHRFSTVRNADLIVVLEAGQVVESGTHAELMAAAGLYAELFTLQARAYA